MTNTVSQDNVIEKLDEMRIWGVHAERLATRIEVENYEDRVSLANEIFNLAEEENRCPRVVVDEVAVEVDVWTEGVDGFTESDLVFAEDVEEIVRKGDWS